MSQHPSSTVSPYAALFPKMEATRSAFDETQPPPVQPQEEGLLPKVAGLAQYAGETLDKPGAAVRGLLGGDPSQLANLIPFSDTLGLTNAAPGTKTAFGGDPFTFQGSKQYGSDLLTKAGVPEAPEEWSWENAPAKIARGAAGFGVDLATDPLMWVTGPLGMMGRAEKEAMAAYKAGGLTAIGEHLGDIGTVLKEANAAGDTVALKSAADKLGAVYANTPIGFANDIRAGDQKLFGIGLPFSDEPWLQFNLMPKEWAANIIEKGFYGAYSPVNWFRGLLSPSVAGQQMEFRPLQQMKNDLNYAAGKYYGSAAQNMAGALRDWEHTTSGMWDDIGTHFKQNEDTKSFQDFFRGMMETHQKLPSSDLFEEEIRKVFSSNMPDDARVKALAQKVFEAHSAMNDITDTLHDALGSFGIKVKDLQDGYVEYAHRRSTAAMYNAAVKREVAAQGGDAMGSNPALQRVYRNMPGGALTFNAIAKDELNWGKKWVAAEDVREMTPQEAWDRINAGKVEVLVDMKPKEQVAAYKKMLRKKLMPELAPGEIPPTTLPETLFDPKVLEGNNRDDLRAAYINEYHIRKPLEDAWPDAAEQRTLKPLEEGGEPRVLTKETETARWKAGDDTKETWNAIKSLGPAAMQNGVFDRSVVTDQLAYNNWAMKNLASVMSAHTFLGKDGIVQSGGVGKSLAKVWQEAGFTRPGLTKFIEQNYGDEFQKGLQKAMQGSDARVSKLVEQGNMAQAEAEKQVMDAARKQAADGILGRLTIHPDAENTLRAYKGAMQPKSQNAILTMLDGMKGFWQRALYNVFPQTLIRDFISHGFNQWSQGEVGLPSMVKSYANAKRFLTTKGGGQDTEFVRELIALGGIRGTDTRDMLQKVIDENKLPFGGFWSNAYKGPTATKTGAELGNTSQVVSKPGWLGKAAGGVAELSGAPALDRTMTRARNYSNFVQRAGYYDALRRAGYSPAQSLDKMLNASFDYGEQSRFSKDVMNRAYLFWGFRSKNIPYQLANVLAEPGGRTSQTLKLLARTANNNNPDVYTPKFLQEQENIPWGNNPEAQGFFHTTAIPFSDLNDIVTGQGALGNIGRTSEKLASGLAPWWLVPLELSAGRQFSTGRPLSTLESPTGNPVLDSAIHYSPLSRGVSTAETLNKEGKTDAQKALGISGLGNVSTYNTARWKLQDLLAAYGQRRAAEGEVPHTDYSLPADKAAKMEPQDVAQAKADDKRSAQLTKLIAAMRKKQDAQKAEATPASQQWPNFFGGQ
jgi:hypothetical protein